MNRTLRLTALVFGLVVSLCPLAGARGRGIGGGTFYPTYLYRDEAGNVIVFDADVSYHNSNGDVVKVDVIKTADRSLPEISSFLENTMGAEYLRLLRINDNEKTVTAWAIKTQVTLRNVSNYYDAHIRDRDQKTPDASSMNMSEIMAQTQEKAKALASLSQKKVLFDQYVDRLGRIIHYTAEWEKRENSRAFE